MNHEYSHRLQNVIRARHTNEANVPGLHDLDSSSEEMAELVHELRQPLSTIEALTYYLELTSTDVQTVAQVKRIQEMLTQANHILERASLRGWN